MRPNAATITIQIVYCNDVWRPSLTQELFANRWIVANFHYLNLNIGISCVLPDMLNVNSGYSLWRIQKIALLQVS